MCQGREREIKELRIEHGNSTLKVDGFFHYNLLLLFCTGCITIYNWNSNTSALWNIYEVEFRILHFTYIQRLVSVNFWLFKLLILLWYQSFDMQKFIPRVLPPYSFQKKLNKRCEFIWVFTVLFLVWIFYTLPFDTYILIVSNNKFTYQKATKFAANFLSASSQLYLEKIHNFEFQYLYYWNWF